MTHYSTELVYSAFENLGQNSNLLPLNRDFVLDPLIHLNGGGIEKSSEF